MSQQKEIGTLIVVVLKAQHLHQPSFYKQNPYCQVSLSGLKKRTKVDPKGGQHPVWDDELRFPVLTDAGKDKQNRILEVSCYKDEQRGDDVFLGKGTVDIEETLKKGEFDDWVPLETSAGARGEVYLEMTFYANSPPPLTRPSKLKPSDRLARPAAYFSHGRQSSPTSTSPSPSPQREHSPTERKPSQTPPGVNQIPSSLIPARGPQGQVSSQGPSNEGTTSTVAVKHKDDPLPPLPATNNTFGVDPGRKLEPPAALHPGGGGGRRLMPPQSRDRVTSMAHPTPQIFPEQLHRRTLSDTPALAPCSPAPMQTYSPEVTSMTGVKIGSTPSIVVEEHVQSHPPFPFPTPLASPPPPTQNHDQLGVYAARNYDSFTCETPGQAYMQPNSQGYAPASDQGTYSLSHRPMPSQSPHIPPGQPQQLYDASPAMTSPPPLSQQYAQYPAGGPTPQPLSPPQAYPQLHISTQAYQQPTPYPVQSQQHPPFHQQPYVPPQQQQYLPPPSQQHNSQPLLYTQTPHPFNGPQPCQQYTATPSPQPSLYSQVSQQPQQSYMAVPPPPPVQAQTSQPYAPQPTRQPQSHFSPPPPPPPLLYSQGVKSPSPVSVTQPLQTPVPPSMFGQGQVPRPTSVQGVAPTPPLHQPPTITTLPSPVVQNSAPASNPDEAIGRAQLEESKDKVRPVTVVEAEAMLREEAKEALQDVTRNMDEEQCNSVREEEGQLAPKGTDEQGSHHQKEVMRQVEDMGRRDEEELQRQEELKRQEEQQREVERSILEEEERRQQEEERRRRDEAERMRTEEECRRREEEEHREREKEERKRREEELRRREEEERRKKEEERRRREEEERMRLEEERRRRGEELRREEERRRREEEERRREEERKRREEEERKRIEEERRREEERRKWEEERRRREEEETERRRKAAEEARRRAEEAEAERRWQEELARIRTRAEQEAADAAFARAQMEAEEAERRRQEEADLALVRQVQEEAEREERLTQERRRQEEADREVARREQVHEEELERRRQEGRRRRMEEADRELARRLDMELNLGTEYSGDQSRQRGAASNGRG